MDEDLARFEEMTKDVDLSRRARRDAKRAARRELESRERTARTTAARATRSPSVARSNNPLARVVAWAESRSYSQSRPWGR